MTIITAFAYLVLRTCFWLYVWWNVEMYKHSPVRCVLIKAHTVCSLVPNPAIVFLNIEVLNVNPLSNSYCWNNFRHQEIKSRMFWTLLLYLVSMTTKCTRSKCTYITKVHVAVFNLHLTLSKHLTRLCLKENALMFQVKYSKTSPRNEISLDILKQGGFQYDWHHTNNSPSLRKLISKTAQPQSNALFVPTACYMLLTYRK